jgi:NAD(P)-dependent dehydrogenase (short-subunit alcohol dehydrogenase family)
VRLQDKVVLITGGGTGIGAATARLCADEGAAVVITGRRQEVLERVVAEITKAGGQALAVAGSVTDEAHVRSAVKQAVGAFGRLDALINNAATRSSKYRLKPQNFSAKALGQRLHETEDETWQELLMVNLGGAFRFMRAAIPYMLDGGGSIINIASIAALVGIPGAAAYSATKGGLLALSRAVAIEYAKEKIRCNCICPGVINTPATAGAIQDPAMAAFLLSFCPIGRIGAPQDVAYLIVYLVSDEASWVTGNVFPIDGGFTAQ